MLARSAQQISPAATPGWHAAFLEMLPKIRRVAEWAFRKVRTEQRDELVCEVIADALVAFARLVALGKQHLAFPTPLARYAVARVAPGGGSAVGCGGATCSRNMPGAATGSRPCDSTASIETKTFGGRSSSRTSGRHPPRSPSFGWILPSG